MTEECCVAEIESMDKTVPSKNLNYRSTRIKRCPVSTSPRTFIGQGFVGVPGAHGALLDVDELARVHAEVDVVDRDPGLGLPRPEHRVKGIVAAPEGQHRTVRVEHIWVLPHHLGGIRQARNSVGTGKKGGLGAFTTCDVPTARYIAPPPNLVLPQDPRAAPCRQR